MYHYLYQERLDNLKLDNRTNDQQTGQNLILRAMNETRNIERLSLSVGKYLCYQHN